MTEPILIVEWEANKRELEQILYESFEGWYLRHSLKKLYEVPVIFAALSGEEAVGIAMLEILNSSSSYIFYIAVKKRFRGSGIASRLVDRCLDYCKGKGHQILFAAVEKDNEASLRLFQRKGFVKTDYTQVSKKFGPVSALKMYRHMMVVPGESLLMKSIS